MVEEFVSGLEGSGGDAKETKGKGSGGLELGGRLMTCGLGLMHVLSLPRTFTLPVPHPDHGLPLSSAELAYTSVPHGVLHGTPPVS